MKPPILRAELFIFTIASVELFSTWDKIDGLSGKGILVLTSIYIYRCDYDALELTIKCGPLGYYNI